MPHSDIRVHPVSQLLTSVQDLHSLVKCVCCSQQLKVLIFTGKLQKDKKVIVDEGSTILTTLLLTHSHLKMTSTEVLPFAAFG